MTRPTEWSRAARVAWVALALLLGPLWLWGTWLRLRGSLHLLTDFGQEWLSARNYLTGLPVYAPLSESIPRHLGPEWGRGLLEVNAHPPGSVLLALPFGLLDYWAAYPAWLALSVVALVLSIWLILRERGLGLSRWIVLPIFTVLVTSNAWAQELNQGQWNSLLLALIVGAWAALRVDPRRGGRGELLAGGLLGMAAALKLFPGFLLLYLAAQRRWKGLAVGLGVFIGWNGLAALVLGPAAIRDYLSVVLPALTRFRDFWPNASLPGLWSKLLVGASGHVETLYTSPLLARVLSVLSVLVLAALVVRRAAASKGAAPANDIAFSFAVVAMLLSSPVAWDHYFLLLTLPLLTLWSHAAPGTWRRWLVIPSVAGLLTVAPAWVYGALIPGPGELAYLRGGEPAVATVGQTLTALSFQLYLLLALAAALYSLRPARKNGDSP